MFPGVADEVPDDEEVAGELHLADDLDFARQPLLVIFQRMLQPAQSLQFAQHVQALGKALARDVLEVVGQRIAGGHFELRERDRELFPGEHCSARRSPACAPARARSRMKTCAISAAALHEKLIAMKLQPVGVVDRLAGLDADHHVLRVRIVLAQIVAVVGRHQRQTKVLFQLQQVGLNALLFGNTLVLDLEIEIALAEDVGVAGGRLAGGVVLPFRQALGNFALQARRQTRSIPANVRPEISC